jgi:uncharacterized protein YeaO (DUF488 family)
MAVALKRAYADPARGDGTRVLVDRLWPRGVSKDAAHIDWWAKELAPSTALRQWFHARPSLWRQFRSRYLEELRAPAAQSPLQRLYELAGTKRTVTLVFASRNVEQNHAVILKELLEGMKKPPGSSGPEKAASPVRARR